MPAKGLTVKIDGVGSELPAYQVRYKRQHGEAVEVFVTIQKHESVETHQILNELVQQVLDKVCEMEIFWNGASISPKLIISEVTSTGSSETEIVIRSIYTHLPGDAYVPRYRILKASNFRELINSFFSKIVTIENSVANCLGEEFPDGKQTNHIQNGISDLEMLKNLVNSYNQSCFIKDPASPFNNTLLLTGNAQDPAYRLVWAQIQKNLELVSTLSADPVSGVKFNRGKLKPQYNWGGPEKLQTVCYEIKHENGYSSGNWENWRKKNLPLRYNGNFVYAIEDLFEYSSEELLKWTSYISILAKYPILETRYGQLPASWIGKGKVTRRDTKNQWMEVRIDNFEKGYNIMNVRLSTPYSGKKQTGGLHLVPEKDTEVLVIKAADWMQPVMLLHNIRNAECEIEAPYWQLEDPTIWSFKDMLFSLRKMETKASDELKYSAKQYKVLGDEDITIKTNGVTAHLDNQNMKIS